MGIVSLGGMPTKIDVDRISERFGVPKEGDTIKRSDIASALRMDADSHRFRTVLDAWRKMLFREHNLLTVGDGNGNIRVADPAERIDWATRRVASGRRCIGRAIAVAHQTDAARLSADQRKTQASIVDLNLKRLQLAAGVMR